MNPLVLQGRDFGSVFGASIFASLSSNWKGRLMRVIYSRYWRSVTQVTRLTTLKPLAGTSEPILKTNLIRGYALVARQYGNRGLERELPGWLARNSRFVIAFASLEEHSSERVYEFRGFLARLRHYLFRMEPPVAIMLDTTVHHRLQLLDHEELVSELRQMLDLARNLGAPILPHVSLTVPVPYASKIALHPACDALSVSSGIPWGGFSDRLDWVKMFGSHDSPFLECGGGELYGKPCLPILMDWVREAKS